MVRPGPGQLRGAAPDVLADPQSDQPYRQGFDVGSQYRSAIFYHDTGQMEAAIASAGVEQQSRKRQIVTQITPASAFYRAEEYHQRYLEKHGHAACAATIR